MGCQNRCCKSIGCAEDVNCGTYACAICRDKIVAKESTQGGKSLSKEAFDDEFFGMWLHLELVHGVHGRCLQLQYQSSIYSPCHLTVSTKLMSMSYSLSLATKFVHRPSVDCICYTCVSLNAL
jgi:hypothetical protein